MTDVCLDMMARYSFSNHIHPPRRTPLMNQLLSAGVSQAWLVGNMLIKITTCSNIPGHCSLCCKASEVLEQDSLADLHHRAETHSSSLHRTNRKGETVINVHDRADSNGTDSKMDKSFCSYDFVESGEQCLTYPTTTNPDSDKDDSAAAAKRSSSFDLHERHDSATLVT